MIRIDGRFEVKLISSTALAQFMEHRGFTVRSLADRVGCSHSVVGHLRSGKRRTCSPDTAKRIELELNAPPGSLFLGNVSHVAREVRSTRKASA